MNVLGLILVGILFLFIAVKVFKANRKGKVVNYDEIDYTATHGLNLKWNVDDTLVALYFAIYGDYYLGAADVLSKAVGRTNSSFNTKVALFESLIQNKPGMKASKLDQVVFTVYGTESEVYVRKQVIKAIERITNSERPSKRMIF